MRITKVGEYEFAKQVRYMWYSLYYEGPQREKLMHAMAIYNARTAKLTDHLSPYALIQLDKQHLGTCLTNWSSGIGKIACHDRLRHGILQVIHDRGARAT